MTHTIVFLSDSFSFEGSQKNCPVVIALHRRIAFEGWASAALHLTLALLLYIDCTHHTDVSAWVRERDCVNLALRAGTSCGILLAQTGGGMNDRSQSADADFTERQTNA
jgi:hypothetical protein